MRGTFLLGLALVAAPLAAQTTTAAYRVGVVSESGDIITWLRPEGSTLVVDHVVPVGIMPADIDGPHNITVSADQRWYYVSIAHGTPYGTLWRFDASQRHPGGPRPAGVLPDHHLRDAGRRVRLRGQLRLPRRPPPRQFRLGGVHPRHDEDHRDPGVRHAARREGEPRAARRCGCPACTATSCSRSTPATFDVMRRAKTGSGMAMPAAAAGAHAGMNHGRRPPRQRARGRSCPRGGQRMRPDLRERVARRPHALRGLQPQGDAAGLGRRSR